MSCHNVKQTGSASRSCCLSSSSLPLKRSSAKRIPPQFVWCLLRVFKYFPQFQLQLQLYPFVLARWRQLVAQCNNKYWKVFHRKFHRKFFKLRVDFFLCDCSGWEKKWASHGDCTFISVCGCLANNKLGPKNALEISLQ